MSSFRRIILDIIRSLRHALPDTQYALDHPWYHQAAALLTPMHATPASTIHHPTARPLEWPATHSAPTTRTPTRTKIHPSARRAFHLLAVLSTS